MLKKRLLLLIASIASLLAGLKTARASASFRAGSQGEVALAIHGMLSAEPSGQAWESRARQLSPLYELMDIRPAPGETLSAAALDQDKNVGSILPPLLAALREKDPELAGPFTPEAIAAALPEARRLVLKKAQELREVLRLYNTEYPEDLAPIRRARELALELYLYQGVYLGGAEAQIGLKKLYFDWLLKEKRASAAAARRKSEAAQRAIARGTREWWMPAGDGVAGGLAEASDLAQRGHPNARLGLQRPVSDSGAADSLRQEYFGLDPLSALASDYPLSGTRERYAEPLERALEANDVTAFWDNVTAAFLDLGARVEEILNLLPKSSMDPETRLRILDKLALHANDLFDDINAMYSAKNPKTGRLKLEQLGDGKNPSAELFNDLVAKIRDADPAHLSGELHSAREEGDARAIGALLKLVSVWRRWLGEAPPQERALMREFLQKGHDSPWMMNLNEAHWNLIKMGDPNGLVDSLFARLATAIAAAVFFSFTAFWALQRSGPSGVLFGGLASIAFAVWGVSYAASRAWRLWSLRRARRWLESQLSD